MMKNFSVLKEEKGSVLVLVAIGFVVLLGFAALVADYGVVALERRKMVTAADAGALAGARVLLESGPAAKGAAEQVAFDYAVANGADPGMVSVDVDDSYNFNGSQIQAVVVNVGQAKDFFFARIFGLESTNVFAEAVGVWSYLGSSGSMFPMYIDISEIDIEQNHYPLHIKNESASANYGIFHPGVNNSAAKDAVQGDDVFFPEILVWPTGNTPQSAPASYQYETETGRVSAFEDELNKQHNQYKNAGRLYRHYMYEKGEWDTPVSLQVLIPVLEAYDSNPGVGGSFDVVVRGFILYEIQDVISDNNGYGSPYATNLGEGIERGVGNKNYYIDYDPGINPGQHKGTIIGMVLDHTLSTYVPSQTYNLIQEGGFGAKYSFLIN